MEKEATSQYRRSAALEFEGNVFRGLTPAAELMLPLPRQFAATAARIIRWDLDGGNVTVVLSVEVHPQCGYFPSAFSHAEFVPVQPTHV